MIRKVNIKNKRLIATLLIFAVVAIVFFITAYNSHGFYHPDEHYQIIEFANAKLGLQNHETLSWEYYVQMRSTLQPLVGCIVFKVLYALNIENPYHQAFCLRLLTALFALVVIHFFIKGTKHLFENQTIQNGYAILSYFLWFIPFLSVRFSSETWSACFFFLR